MSCRVVAAIVVAVVLGSGATAAVPDVMPKQDARVHLTLDASEAEQVLAVLAVRAEGRAVSEAQWRELFATVPYRRLQAREAEIGKQFHDPSRAFTDEDFKKFVLSGDLARRAGMLAGALERWRTADLDRCAARALAYLPGEATIRAKVYPVIKPGTNSFVWGPSSDRAIFLYLDPEITPAKFENTVAHELHHIGLGSLGDVYDRKIASLPEGARAAADWMGAFGEGLAMLAAAGGPDVDPHAASDAKERARWERDLAKFAPDLATVGAFFADTIGGKFADRDAIDAKASSFFGAQGPWYTVGYRMAVMVERRFGRAALIRTMTDPRCLLALYNRAAAERNALGKEQLPLWPEAVLQGVGAGECANGAS